MGRKPGALQEVGREFSDYIKDWAPVIAMFMVLGIIGWMSKACGIVYKYLDTAEQTVTASEAWPLQIATQFDQVGLIIVDKDIVVQQVEKNQKPAYAIAGRISVRCDTYDAIWDSSRGAYKVTLKLPTPFTFFVEKIDNGKSYKFTFE